MDGRNGLFASLVTSVPFSCSSSCRTLNEACRLSDGCQIKNGSFIAVSWPYNHRYITSGQVINKRHRFRFPDNLSVEMIVFTQSIYLISGRHNVAIPVPYSLGMKLQVYILIPERTEWSDPWW